jgi:hypothetical protein
MRLERGFSLLEARAELFIRRSEKSGAAALVRAATTPFAHDCAQREPQAIGPGAGVAFLAPPS